MDAHRIVPHVCAMEERVHGSLHSSALWGTLHLIIPLNSACGTNPETCTILPNLKIIKG